MKRIVLFLATNLAVVLVVSIVLSILGIGRPGSGTSTSHNWRSKLTSPCPLPVYRQNPRFTTAPHAGEIAAPVAGGRDANSWTGPGSDRRIGVRSR